MKTLLILLLVLAVLFLLLLLLLRPDPSARKKMAPFVGRRYAHRGLHCAQDGIPENSLPAFRRAVEAGYGIELDLHLTTDGRLVVFHDDTLDRVCGVTGRVDEKSYAELQQLRLLGTEERIPLFSEVLDIVAGKIPMIVEVKYQKNYPALCEKMMSQLRDYTGLYCVESFHPQVILWMKNHAPAVARGLLSDRYTEGEGNMTRLTPATWASQQLLFNWLTAPDFIAYNYLTARCPSSVRYGMPPASHGRSAMKVRSPWPLPASMPSSSSATAPPPASHRPSRKTDHFAVSLCRC